MAWQSFNTSGHRDLLTKMVAMATSKYVSAVVLNAAGAGYTAGDILTIGHAGAQLTATVEVLTIGGGGSVATYHLRNMGAYSNRVATVAINAAGTGYVANDIVEIQGGTFREKAKAKVTTVGGGGAATAVALFETGGSYTVAPAATAAVTDSTPGTGTGTGLTLDTTMTALIGTTGAAVTGGTGAGATFDLTLTDVGWTAVRNRNDYSFNSILDEKEVVLQGDAGSADDPLCGFRTYTQTVGPDTRYGILMTGMTAHNPGTSFDSQAGSSPQTTPSNTQGTYIAVLPPATMPAWFSITERKICGILKTQGGAVLSYQSWYTGLMNPFGTAVENPYPFFLGASSAISNQQPDATSINITGIVEAASPAGVTGPCYFYRASDASWQQVSNNENNSSTVQPAQFFLYPYGQQNNIGTDNGTWIVDDGAIQFFKEIVRLDRSAATRLLKPTPMTGGDLFVLIPVTLIATPQTVTGVLNSPQGELHNVFWVSSTKSDGTKFVSEDTLTQGGVRYRIFQNGGQIERYQYFCMAEA